MFLNPASSSHTNDSLAKIRRATTILEKGCVPDDVLVTLMIACDNGIRNNALIRGAENRHLSSCLDNWTVSIDSLRRLRIRAFAQAWHELQIIEQKMREMDKLIKQKKTQMTRARRTADSFLVRMRAEWARELESYEEARRKLMENRENFRASFNTT